MEVTSGYGNVIGGLRFPSEDARCKENETLRGIYHSSRSGWKRSRTLDLISASAMAYAMPTPSSGEVPLPTSSINTKDLGVARPAREYRGIAEVRGSSTNRVSLHNLPFHWRTCSNSSPCRHHSKVVRAGSRVSCADVSMRLSNHTALITHPKLAYSAGTKHPHIPMTVSSPTCLRYVLFPANVDSWYRSGDIDLCFAVVRISHKPHT